MLNEGDDEEKRLKKNIKWTLMDSKVWYNFCWTQLDAFIYFFSADEETLDNWGNNVRNLQKEVGSNNNVNVTKTKRVKQEEWDKKLRKNRKENKEKLWRERHQEWKILLRRGKLIWSINKLFRKAKWKKQNADSSFQQNEEMFKDKAEMKK